MSILGTNLNAGPRAGTASIAIAGAPFDVAGDAVYNTVSLKRETMKGQSGVQGFSEMPDAPGIGATIRDAGWMTTAAFMAMRSVTVTLVLANGKVVSGAGMWCTECSEIKTQEGSFSLKFEGYEGSVVETPAL